MDCRAVGRIEDAGRERATRKDGNEMAAYDHVLRGRECLAGLAESGLTEARGHFNRALEMNGAANAEIGTTRMSISPRRYGLSTLG